MTKTFSFYNKLLPELIGTRADEPLYLFAASSNTDFASDSYRSQYDAYDFLENTLFGKRIIAGELLPAIRRNNWVAGRIYPFYDDRKDNAETYITVPSLSVDGPTKIFKCLFNGNGSVSTQRPDYNESLPSTRVSYPDGYVWQYLYEVSQEQLRKFASGNFIPVIQNPSYPTDDGLDTIIVENTNTGYSSYSFVVSRIGTLVGSAQRIYITGSGSVLPTISGFFNNQAFYVTSTNLVSSRSYTIVNSGVLDGENYVDIEGYNPVDFTIGLDFTGSILPRVEITGDGTGCKAIPVLTGSSITSIRVLSRGDGYTRASARIVRPAFDFDPNSVAANDVSAIIRPIVPPRNGHGSNLIEELGATHIIIGTSFSQLDINIPAESFNRVGLVENPSFVAAPPNSFDNRISILLDSVVGLTVGSIVSQDNFRGVIRSISGNTIRVSDFFGPSGNITDTSDLTQFNGTLNVSEQLQTPVGRINIVSVTYPSYVQRSGNVIYLADSSPVTRTSTSEEQYKFLIKV